MEATEEEEDGDTNKINPESQDWASVQLAQDLFDRCRQCRNMGLGVAMTVLERYEAGRLRVDDPKNLIQVLQNVGLGDNRRDKRRA